MQNFDLKMNGSLYDIANGAKDAMKEFFEFITFEYTRILCRSDLSQIE